MNEEQQYDELMFLIINAKTNQELDEVALKCKKYFSQDTKYFQGIKKLVIEKRKVIK